MRAASSRRAAAPARIELFALRSLPEIKPGDDLGGLIHSAVRREELELLAGDV